MERNRFVIEITFQHRDTNSPAKIKKTPVSYLLYSSEYQDNSEI